MIKTKNKPLFKNVMNKIDNELHIIYLKLLIRYKIKKLKVLKKIYIK
jgi:hypothetical protein